MGLGLKYGGIIPQLRNEVREHGGKYLLSTITWRSTNTNAETGGQEDVG